MHSYAPSPQAAGTAHTPEAPPPRLLRLALVEERTSLKKSAIYAAIRAGTFPAPVRLTAHAVAWHETAINSWINSRCAVIPRDDDSHPEEGAATSSPGARKSKREAA